MTQNIRILFFTFLLLALFSTVYGFSVGAVDVNARIEGRTQETHPSNILQCFGNKTVKIHLSIGKYCSDKIGLKVELRQLAGKIAVPLGVVYELPFSVQAETKDKNVLSFMLKIPEVQRKTNFELLYFTQQGENDPWQPANSTTIEVYPNVFMEKMYGYTKEAKFVILDPSGILQRLFTNEKVPFIDFLHHSSQIEKIDTKTTIVALCTLQTDGSIYSKNELEEQISIIEDFTGTLIIFKDRGSRLSQLFVKQQDQTFQVIAEIDLLTDLIENPRSQLNVLEVVDLIFNHIHSGE